MNPCPDIGLAMIGVSDSAERGTWDLFCFRCGCFLEVKRLRYFDVRAFGGAGYDVQQRVVTACSRADAEELGRLVDPRGFPDVVGGFDRITFSA